MTISAPGFLCGEISPEITALLPMAGQANAYPLFDLRLSGKILAMNAFMAFLAR